MIRMKAMKARMAGGNGEAGSGVVAAATLDDDDLVTEVDPETGQTVDFASLHGLIREAVTAGNNR